MSTNPIETQADSISDSDDLCFAVRLKHMLRLDPLSPRSTSLLAAFLRIWWRDLVGVILLCLIFTIFQFGDIVGELPCPSSSLLRPSENDQDASLFG